MTSLRTAIAAALVAAGTLVSTFSPAQAGDPSFGIYFDGQAPANEDSTAVGMRRGIDFSLTDARGKRQFPNWNFLQIFFDPIDHRCFRSRFHFGSKFS